MQIEFFLINKILKLDTQPEIVTDVYGAVVCAKCH